MKTTKYIIASAIALTACDDYLDTLPDNRAELNSEAKIAKLLVSAYPENDYLLINEYMSDNVDEFDGNPNTDRFLDQVYAWKDVTEDNNESPKQLWDACYGGIAAANQALLSIEELGGAETESLRESKGEALICRAYNYFILVNEFCLPYNSKTCNTVLGLPYPEKPETELNPHYERGTLKEAYEKIERDILAALPLIDKGTSEIKKFHFSKNAAYAFAARFYLYYENWAEAERYADLCLGDSPANILRDWSYIAGMTQTAEAITRHYVDASVNANLLLIPSYSYMGLCFGPYRYGARYAHGNYLANYETGNASNIWGSGKFYSDMKVYSATNMEKTIFWKLPYIFEETDPTNGIGYYRTTYPAFTTDECLINRAEARVMQGKYDDAANDLDMWMHNIIQTDTILTPELIQTFYNSIKYCTGLESTVKKHINPSFSIDAEGSLQETMLQCVLGFRRIETLQAGMRWFDVRRYGIEIVRRTMNEKSRPAKVNDTLTKDDLRRAIQVPQESIAAGFEANPR